MSPDTLATIRNCLRKTHNGEMHFGQVVAVMLAAGVESYRADVREKSVTFFLPSGEFCREDLRLPDEALAADFSNDGLVAAIRAAQAGTLMYPEFLKRMLAAGCAGYVVWFGGRHVAYYGRNGEMHIEHFPPEAAKEST